jgi:hypothetical protein
MFVYLHRSKVETLDFPKIVSLCRSLFPKILGNQTRSSTSVILRETKIWAFGLYLENQNERRRAKPMKWKRRLERNSRKWEERELEGSVVVGIYLGMQCKRDDFGRTGRKFPLFRLCCHLSLWNVDPSSVVKWGQRRGANYPKTDNRISNLKTKLIIVRVRVLNTVRSGTGRTVRSISIL